MIGPKRSARSTTTTALAARAKIALAVVVFAVVVVAVASPPIDRAAAASSSEPADRLLIISIPELTWEDIADADLPNIEALTARSGVANMAVRVERLATSPRDGYATLGAGTRAYGTSHGTAAYDLDGTERGVRARDEFRRRTGEDPGDAAIAVMGIKHIVDENESGLFDGQPGALGDALVAAGIDVGVVGNADIVRFGSTERDYGREVALGLMTSRGTVGCGSVSASLLRDDPDGAFGQTLDADRVITLYERCRGTGRSVVMVEASALRREQEFAGEVAASNREPRRQAALSETDALVGRLLDVAGEDAVMIVAPSVPGSTPRLMTFAVSAGAGGVDRPSLLDSPSTRQQGFVTLPDVAPTVAAIMGVELDVDEIEGRAVSVAGGPAASEARVEFLVEREEAARFRDRMQAPVVTTFITAVSVLVILIALRFHVASLRRIPNRVLIGFASAVLFVPPFTYLVALLPMHDWGSGAYALVVFGGAALFGSALGWLHRGWFTPLVAPLALLLVVIASSVVLLDSRLQLSTVLGDSPIIAGRFTGINNVTFSTVVAAAILLGAVLMHSMERRRALFAIGVLFGAVIVVDVAPMWGADVGGILAGLPGLVLAFVLLAGWRIRWRTVVAVAGATVAAVVVLGFFDLARDPTDRTHLGRLFERVGADGFNGLWTMVNRKLFQNLRTLTGSIWRFILIPVLLSAGMLALVQPRPLAGLRERFASLRPALVAISVAGLLGYALNDSGIAIPAMMLAVLAPFVGALLLSAESES